MGYELARFIDEVDDEFHCPICRMVMENPLQTPCEHTFCNECIKGWLVINNSCPVDRKSMGFNDLKPAARCLRNMLDKLKIKCDFEADGCELIVKLEHLQVHLNSCEYKLNSEIVCGKGCNIKMNGREYKTHNCYLYLQEENRKLNDELSSLRCHQEDITRMSGEITELNGIVDRLNDEVIDVDAELQHSKNVIIRQQAELAKLTNFTDSLSNGPPMWQVCDNIKISMSINRPNVLEFGEDIAKGAFAQSFSYLQSKKSFKVQILNARGTIGIGLTRKGHPIDETPGFHGGIGYSSIGLLDFRKKSEKIGSKWKVGDIIECGIELPLNIEDVFDIRDDIALAYFFRNGQLITKQKIEIPEDGIFPTVYMDGAGDKVFYFGIDTLESNLAALGLLKRKYIDLK